jgi:hypothetical protein
VARAVYQVACGCGPGGMRLGGGGPRDQVARDWGL